MRKITMWDMSHPRVVQEVNLLDDDPNQKYIAIQDDLGEVVMIPTDRWNDFVEACQRLKVSP